MSVTSLVEWRSEVSPGEPFRVPAHWVVPHAGGFWADPKHVVEFVDPERDDYGCLGTYSIEPWNEFLARHWVYTAHVGQENARNDESTGMTIYSRYLGIYRVWGLTPNDWRTGTLGFTPVH